jgi:hypothetical protein
MGGVFINYRVRDQPGYATLLYRELSARFGAKQTFIASSSIRPGENYASAVFDTLRSCDVMLAIIGQEWHALLGEPDHDWVYRELREAFELGLRVIPVLVEDAALPATKELPAGIDALAHCQYVCLRHYSIGSDMDHLVRELRKALPAQPPPVTTKTSGAHASAHRVFKNPTMAVRVVVGDLFDQPGQLMVGFTTTFDTDTTDDLVISESAVQGQLLHRFYDGDREQLDEDLEHALRQHHPIAVESPADKRLGKLTRYQLGTVAVLSRMNRRIFCCAYSEMGNDLVARSTVDQLWASLGLLWSAVAEYGKLAPLTMPIVGSDLARIDPLDRENLLKLILMSFVARSRERLFCKELRIVVHPKDFGEINLTQVAAYLRRL